MQGDANGVYRSTDATPLNRARLTFTNHCDNRNANELLITKRLAAGSEALYNGDTFELVNGDTYAVTGDEMEDILTP